ncbi:MAG: ferritin-like domain-containing protein, partial [Bacteroidota bacterium]
IIGYKPVSHFSDYLYMSDIVEDKESLNERDMVATLLTDLQTLSDKTLEAIQSAQDSVDLGTEDMLVGYLKTYEEEAWKLDAFLRRQPSAIV